MNFPLWSTIPCSGIDVNILRLWYSFASLSLAVIRTLEPSIAPTNFAKFISLALEPKNSPEATINSSDGTAMILSIWQLLEEFRELYYGLIACSSQRLLQQLHKPLNMLTKRKTPLTLQIFDSLYSREQEVDCKVSWNIADLVLGEIGTLHYFLEHSIVEARFVSFLSPCRCVSLNRKICKSMIAYWK